MALYEKIRGTVEVLFRLGLGQAQFKSVGTSTLEARDSTDTAYAIMRGATPVGANDLTTKNYVDGIVVASGSAVLLWGSSSVTASTTSRYLAPGGSDTTAHTTVWEFRAPRGGTAKNLRIRHNTPSGNGNLITYTLLVNGAASTLTATLASTATDGNDLTHTVTIAAGDFLSIQVTKALNIAASPSDIVAVLEFTS